MAKFLGPSFDINTGPGGDEGGEIRLSTAETNTTLNGPIKIDVYQNKLRFFEGGSPNRGAYIDLSSASNGVGSNLLSGGGGATTLDGLSDVTAPSPASGDFLKWNGSAWVNDAIDLATDTTGNYVSSLVAGSGITLTNNSGEAATPTITVDTSATLPAGSLQMFAGASAPSGWLLCNGQSVSRTTYATLFGVIGTTYGSVDGSSFTLPDMRGRTPIGVGTGTGLTARTLSDTGGVESVTLTGAQSGTSAHGHGHTFSVSDGVADRTGLNDNDHTHTFTVNGRQAPSATHGHTGTTTAATAASNSTAPNQALGGTTSGQSVQHRHAITFSGAVSNSTAANASSSHENMPPFIAVNFIIKV